MRISKCIAAIAGATAAVACAWCLAAEKGSKTVTYLATIRLPGKGYVDYLVVSPGGELYAGYATENALVVLDTRKREVAATVKGLNDVRSIALVPDLNRGFTSNRGDGTIGVIDLKNSRLLHRIPNGKGPDAIIYDEAARLVYVANHEGRSATLLDPAAENITAVIPLGGTAEYAQADPKSGLVYQNLEDANEVAVVDSQKRVVVARHKTAPGREPTGLALDAPDRRLFCACANRKLIVMNLDTGEVVAALPIGAGVDSVAFDAGFRRIYTANGGSGTMTVIRAESPDHYVVLENVSTQKGAHALAVDPATHRVYVVNQNTINVYEAVTESGSQPSQKGGP